MKLQSSMIHSRIDQKILFFINCSANVSAFRKKKKELKQDSKKNNKYKFSQSHKTQKITKENKRKQKKISIV
jgi:hypothetical protein